MNYHELAQHLNISESTITTNFPKLKSKYLAKGLLIEKNGKGEKAEYAISEVEPQNIESSYFSTRPTSIIVEDLEGEVWKPVHVAPSYQVSNFGRIKNPQGSLNTGYISAQGYVLVSIKDKTYRVHRLVLQAFDPQPNYDELTVDHLNGIRSDNRLENLRWATGEQNTFTMLANRAELHKELTRIIQKFGYEETLNLLQNL